MALRRTNSQNKISNSNSFVNRTDKKSRTSTGHRPEVDAPTNWATSSPKWCFSLNDYLNKSLFYVLFTKHDSSICSYFKRIMSTSFIYQHWKSFPTGNWIDLSDAIGSNVPVNSLTAVVVNTAVVEELSAGGTTRTTVTAVHSWLWVIYICCRWCDTFNSIASH